MPDPLQPGVLPRRDRALIIACILLVTALAWIYLIRLDRDMSSAMEHDKMMPEMGMTMGMAMDMPWSASDAALTFAMWAVMMAGMMSGSALPVLLLFAGAQAARGPRHSGLAVAIFGLGYLLVWTGFSAIATFAQWALHQAAMLSSAMVASNTKLAGVILIAAGAWQLTPWKSACLAHCRTPLGFLMTHWRDGRLGALRMGLSHGAYCLGCCWALMCVLFAVGVMNLVWVAALTIFVLIEKIGPAGVIVARAAGASMVAFGALRFVGIA